MKNLELLLLLLFLLVDVVSILIEAPATWLEISSYPFLVVVSPLYRLLFCEIIVFS
jgi:hypothetical protein